MAEAALAGGHRGDQPIKHRGEHRGVRAVQRMVGYAPPTASLALWVHHHDKMETSATDDAPPVTTDGITLRYGPGFGALPLPQQVG